ncbi:MAG: SMC-Scp complex subunit ScpB, partial [Candidatus Latescibacteria bacterium]|nr:SMC-Scp complex subunit ScpB [Candidatus Latescibacterota bacterium]
MSDTDDSLDLAPDEHARNRGILEALLIASDEPIPVGKITSVIDRVGPREIRDYVDDLNHEYAETGRSFKITEIAGGFQLMVHPEYAPWARRLMRGKAPARLSQASLETLAIIAFRQPLTKAEVEHIRGVSVDGVIRHLLEKGLLRIAGRAEGIGRPLLYGTTRDFLKHFGLKTLSDLPKLRELEDLLREEEERTGEVQSLGDLIQGVASGSGAQEGDAESDAYDEGESLEDGPSGTESGTPEPVPGPGGSGIPEGERSPDSGGQDH